MASDLERADREIISRLAEAGLRPHAPLCLAYRLVAVDRLAPEEVARTLGIAVGTVHSRVSKVHARLLGAQDEHARAAVEDPEPDPEAPDPLAEEARALLEAQRNRDAEAGAERPAAGSPLVSIRDAMGIISEAADRRAAP